MNENQTPSIDPKSLDLTNNQPKKKDLSQYKLLPMDEDVFDADRARRLKNVGPGANDPLQARPDLREGPFRKYEPFILAVLRDGSQSVKSFEGQTASTFACRFRDAILGFKRYKYLSEIPKDANLDCLKARPTESGRVWIDNPVKDKENYERMKAREAQRGSYAEPPIAPAPVATAKPASLAASENPKYSAWRSQIESTILTASWETPFIYDCFVPEDRQNLLTIFNDNPHDMSMYFKDGKAYVYNYNPKSVLDLPTEDVFGAMDET